MLTTLQLQQLKLLKSPAGQNTQSMTPEQAMASFSSTPTTSSYNTAMGIGDTTPGIIPQAYSQFSKGFEQTKLGVNNPDMGKGLIDIGQGILNEGAAGIRAAFSPVEAITKIVSQLPGINQIVGGTNAAVQAVATSPYNPLSNSKFVQDYLQNNPNAEEVTRNLMSVLAPIIIGKAYPEWKMTGIAPKIVGDTATKIGNMVTDTASKISDTTSSVVGKVTDTVTGRSPVGAPLDEAKVNDLYNRSIRPTVMGKPNAGAIAKGKTNVISGLNSIVENKANLSFTDADGQVIAGETPKSVDQLNQSIAQTKQSIFKQYDALAKQAGDKGVTVDTTSIAKELQTVVDSKSLSIANPKAVKYAKDLQKRLGSSSAVDAQTAQDVIEHYNASLKAFYRNPTYDTATNASIDALVANKFRVALDEGISGATGEQYQNLKNQYGALSSMEKDVAHRSVVWGRQNKIGLGANIANIASGAELLRGLITMNPADIGVSLGIKGIQKLVQYLNNPDVGISRIFSAIDRANPASTGSTIHTLPATPINKPYP